MFTFSNISTNLIGVSFVSAMMVFWLGSRYWSDAHIQFSGARQVQRSVAPETSLFEIADSLDRERNAIQRTLVNAKRFEGDLDHLRELSRNTKFLFEQLRQDMSLFLADESSGNQHRYSNETIEFLIAELDDRLKRVSVARSVITGQLYLPIVERNENVRMQMFDAYSKFIIAVNDLRQRIHSYPEKNYIGVMTAHEIKDAIWLVKESINQTSTLVEMKYLKHQNLTIDSLNAENLTLRLLQNHERVNQAFSDLAEIVPSNTMFGVSSDAISRLEEHYQRIYYSLVKQTILASPLPVSVDGNLADWQRESVKIKREVYLLEKAAISNTLSIAESIKRNATISLIINTFIVLLCMIMAYATFRIAKKIQHQADHDELTGISNRRYFRGATDALLRKIDTSKNEKLVLMTLDLNGFKSVNDALGHVVGDSLLIQVAKKLSSVVSEDMVLARMGGDEFSIVYATHNPASAIQLAGKVRDSFEHPIAVEDGFVNVDASIGYSVYPDHASTLTDLQRTSDFAMFFAKQSGKKTVQSFDSDIAKQFRNRIAIEKDLVIALENHEFEIYYQPQVCLVSRQVTSVEALIRWIHPTRGFVPPNEFISVAEDTGLMPAIGSWVLNEACRQASHWHNNENMRIRVGVNVSVQQISQTDFVQEVFATIEKHNIPADCLELEITESVVVADISWVVKCLDLLRERGVRIALDDFGTGYSSLSHLQELPLDTLKIDQSFIKKLDNGSRQMRSVTATIVSIAEIYGLETVAEGIETDKQLFEVSNLGIDIAQGYYYSKPLPQYDVINMISDINDVSHNHKKSA